MTNTITTTRPGAVSALVLVVLTSIPSCESRRTEKAKAQPPRSPDATQHRAPKIDGGSVSPIVLTWSLQRAADGKSLVLEYEIENRGDEAIFVVDDHAKATVKGLEVAPTAVAVHPGADAKTARLIAGHVPMRPGVASAVVPIAPAHELAAEARRKGTKTVSLPLAGWIEAEGRAVDLTGASQATFEVTWIRPPPADRADWAWEVQKDAAGKTIRTPFIGYVNTMGGQAEAGPIPIP